MGEKHGSLAPGSELGSTNILTAVFNAGGVMLSRGHSITPAREGQQAVVRSTIESAGRAFEQAQISAADITAIGMGAPGLWNPETGILFTSPNLPGWKDAPLRYIIEKTPGIKAFLTNDANA